MDLTLLYWTASAGFAVAYLAQAVQPPSLTRTMQKAIAIGALVLITLLDNGFYLLALGLICYMASDVFLERRGESGRGGAAAAAGQFFYLVLLINQGGGLGMDAAHIAMQVALLIAAGVRARLLWPTTDQLDVPIAAFYVLVVVVTFCAVGLSSSHWLVSLGAVMLASSYALRAPAWTRTVGAAAGAPPLIWTLYWLGQAGLTAGFLYPMRI
jgi:hypothetical protein